MRKWLKGHLKNIGWQKLVPKLGALFDLLCPLSFMYTSVFSPYDAFIASLSPAGPDHLTCREAPPCWVVQSLQHPYIAWGISCMGPNLINWTHACYSSSSVQFQMVSTSGRSKAKGRSTVRLAFVVPKEAYKDLTITSWLRWDILLDVSWQVKALL